MMSSEAQNNKLDSILSKYHVEELKDTKDAESIRRIATEMIADGFFEVAKLLGNDSATFHQISNINRSIMEQNFIIIRQLDRIATSLKPTPTPENTSQYSSNYELPIRLCNVTSPFYAKTVVYDDTDQSRQYALSVFCKEDATITAIEGDLYFNNIFDETTIVNNVCFLGFEKQRNNYYISEKTHIDLPMRSEKYYNAVDFLVNRYKVGEEIIKPAITEMDQLIEVRSQETSTFDKDAFMLEVDSLNTAGEIYELMERIESENEGTFPPDLLNAMKKSASMERIYGAAKKSALGNLKRYGFE